MPLLEKLLRSKVFIWILIILPGLWPAWPIARQDPTVLADPLKFLLHHMGFVACVLLVAVLMFTPLRVIFPQSKLALALNRHRRLVGVSAFVYGALHFALYVIYSGDFATIKKEFTKPFILAGAVTLTILLVLAITSLHRVVRWMGGKRWKNLHRLAYVAAALAAYHQAAARKLFPVQVLWLFVPLVVLEILRVLLRRSVQPGRPAAS